jgi:hypothetical protein
MRKFSLCLLVLVFCSSLMMASPLCTTATLASYVGNTCAIGSLDFNFTAAAITQQSQGFGLAVNDITVAPIIVGDNIGLEFSSQKFNVTNNVSSPRFFTLSLDFNVDAHVPLIIGALGVINPVGDAPMTTGSGTTSLQKALIGNSSEVDINATQLSREDGGFFASPQTTVSSLHETFQMNSSSSGSATVASFDNLFTVPEPVGLALTGSALIGLAFLRRKKAK